ncbi:hypothetical protein F4780DRAFT_56128 [Xylariomycetidae sp. FL0641]|nr:hypothetical protein F4780DRAFT_56128 [Xylariomycetidae sp. FL0641]
MPAQFVARHQDALTKRPPSPEDAQSTRTSLFGGQICPAPDSAHLAGRTGGEAASHSLEHAMVTGTGSDPLTLYEAGLYRPWDSSRRRRSSSSSSSRGDDDPGRNRKPATLLTLPYEIRQEIFGYLLTLPTATLPPSASPSPPASASASASARTPSPLPPTRLYPAILRTSRQLHAEGVRVLYSSNTFLAHPVLLCAFPSLYNASMPSLRYPCFASPSPFSPSSSFSPPTPTPHTMIRRFHVLVRLDAAPRFCARAAAAQLSGRAEVVLEAWRAAWRGAGPDALRLFEGVRGVRRARVVFGADDDGEVGEAFADYARWLERAMMRRVGERVRPFAWGDDDGGGGGGGGGGRYGDNNGGEME